ncbi:unnamed protein product [Staurois parvus]|uniref:Uncharacterized protein n=1 Tax=Staurois parvus TaxID=386267 RepID=A0ABN9HVD5_9NEOB|nr:unnamed protein product [Staurois parvus]
MNYCGNISRVMTETESAPAAAPPAEAAAKKKPAKKASAGGGAKKGIKKASGPAVSELLVKPCPLLRSAAGCPWPPSRRSCPPEDTMWTRTRAA